MQLCLVAFPSTRIFAFGKSPPHPNSLTRRDGFPFLRRLRGLCCPGLPGWLHRSFSEGTHQKESNLSPVVDRPPVECAKAGRRGAAAMRAWASPATFGTLLDRVRALIASCRLVMSPSTNSRKHLSVRQDLPWSLQKYRPYQKHGIRNVSKRQFVVALGPSTLRVLPGRSL